MGFTVAADVERAADAQAAQGAAVRLLQLVPAKITEAAQSWLASGELHRPTKVFVWRWQKGVRYVGWYGPPVVYTPRHYTLLQEKMQQQRNTGGAHVSSFHLATRSHSCRLFE